MRSKAVASLFLVLAFCFAAPMLANASNTSFPPATVAYYTCNPASGGPGTIVHLVGGQWYGNGGEVQLSRSPMGRSPGPSGPPLATVQHDQNGNWEASIVVPATWPSGEPIAQGIIYFAAPTEADYCAFNFTPAGMPATGQAGNTVSVLIAALSLMVVLMGLVLRVGEKGQQHRLAG